MCRWEEEEEEEEGSNIVQIEGQGAIQEAPPPIPQEWDHQNAADPRAMPLYHQALLTSKVGFLALLQSKFWVPE